MKLKFGKDKFKLFEILKGEPISCATCEHFSVPESEHCKGPKIYYQYLIDKEKKEYDLLSFCENYKAEKE